MKSAYRLLAASTAILFAVSSLSATAQTAPIVERYFAALEMGQVFEILRDEGLEGGREMAREDPGVTASPAWSARLDTIYDTPRARDLFAKALGETEALEQSDAALGFFETDLGRRIVALELDARRAMADDDVTDTALIRAQELENDDPARHDLYAQFIDVNTLVDSNVSGALNANMAFYRGMATQDQFEDVLTEPFILSTVWEQESEIRSETQDWTISFAALAYDTLTPDEMADYIDISRSPSGRKLNAALFAGFNAVFEQQSYDLGRAMAEFSAGEDT